MCVKALGEKLNFDNIIDMLNIAEMHDAEELKKLILEYVIKNKNELELKPGFKEAIEAQPKLMKELFWFQVCFKTILFQFFKDFIINFITKYKFLDAIIIELGVK